jgi:hypothetical protein
MPSTVDWFAQKIASALPSDATQDDAEGHIRSLAQAMAGLTGQKPTAFGMHLSDENRAACRSMWPTLGAALKAWHATSKKNERLVDRIALEYGVRVGPRKQLRCDPLGTPELLTEAQRATINALQAALSQPKQLTPLWADNERLPDDDYVVCVRVGNPDGEALRDMAEMFEQRYELPFPVELAHTLSRFNGIYVNSHPPEDLESFGEGPYSVPAPDLLELQPQLWPPSGEEHYMLADDSSRRSEDFVIGADELGGHLALRVTRKGIGGVRWLQDGNSELLADHFTDFLKGWIDAGLSLSLLLHRRSISGW